MIALLKRIAMSSVVASLSAGSAFADGVEVGGNVTNVAIVKQATNVASGINSTANQTVGVVSGSVEVGGSIRNVTVIGEVVNLATGLNTVAEMSVGSIRDAGSSSDIKQTIFVRKIINLSGGIGTKSCLSLGYGKHC